MLFIVSMQYALDITPELRTCLDYVFILKENIYQNRKRLYDHYCGMFPSLDIFQQVFLPCTEDYQCMVINNTNISNKVEDIVFWYKADYEQVNKPFVMGGTDYWKFASKKQKREIIRKFEEEGSSPP